MPRLPLYAAGDCPGRSTPIALTEAVTDPDHAAAKHAFDAMMQMKKIDIATIEAARRGPTVVQTNVASHQRLEDAGIPRLMSDQRSGSSTAACPFGDLWVPPGEKSEEKPLTQRRREMSSQGEPDIVDECLSLAPEPFKSIIQRRKDEGWFGTILNGFQERYTLTEDQLDTVTIVAFRAACDPDSLDSMKDILIAEADVSYEQAVKIQRDIARDIILPIKDEGDRLVNTRPGDTRSFSTASAGPTGSRGDDALFQNDDLGIALTFKLLKYREQTFPTRSIANVAAFEQPFEFKAFVINGIIALIGVPIVLSFSLWSLLGLGMVALGAFNMKDMVTKKYIVTVEIRGAADLRFEFTDKSSAIALRDAFQLAMAAN
jgi:hypothetical protein